MLFDEVLQQIGEGIFQKFAIAVCGLSILAEAIATTAVPFAMVLVSCDLKITVDHILGLNAILVIAMLLSGYWLGGISDMSGRKYILSTTSIITFVGCFVASFSQCVIMLFISLFLLGLGLGGSHSATRIFIIEITPQSIRGSRFVVLEVFSAVGYAVAVGLSRLLVPPLASSLLGNNVRLNSWRILFGLSGSLSIFSACLMSVFPASPRWLLGKKQEDDAIGILRKIFAVNKVKHEESFPNITLDPIMHVNTRPDSHLYQCNNPFIRSFRCVRIYTKHLFTKKFVKTTLTSILICTFFFDGSVFSSLFTHFLPLVEQSVHPYRYSRATQIIRTLLPNVYGIFSGILLSVKRTHSYLNYDVAVVVSRLVMMNIWLSLVIFSVNIDKCMLNGASPVVAGSSNQICNQTTLEDLFKMNAYLSLCSFVVVLLLCVADRIPRKFILMISSITAGLAMAALAFTPIEVFRISLAFIIMSLMFIAEITFRVIVLESYPTALRCTAYGFIKIFSKLFLIFMMLFLRVQCTWAFIAFGALFVLSGFLSLLLPNLNMAPMRD